MPQTSSRGPHWLIVTLVGIAMTLALGYFGLSDLRWRAQESQPPVPPTSMPPSPETSLNILTENGSVQVKSIGFGGVEVSWREVNHPELDHYSPTLHAFSPVSTSLSIGFYSGDTTTQMRLFPFKEYAEAEYARRYGDPPPDQLWIICFNAYKETPLDVLATPYLIEKDICSDPFRVPN